MCLTQVSTKDSIEDLECIRLHLHKYAHNQSFDVKSTRHRYIHIRNTYIRICTIGYSRVRVNDVSSSSKSLKLKFSNTVSSQAWFKSLQKIVEVQNGEWPYYSYEHANIHYACALTILP